MDGWMCVCTQFLYVCIDIHMIFQRMILANRGHSFVMLCECIHACMHACMHVCAYEICMYACMHVCEHEIFPVNMFANRDQSFVMVCMYACMHVCMYARMHVCAYEILPTNDVGQPWSQFRDVM
jgi:hypothetical protein